MLPSAWVHFSEFPLYGSHFMTSLVYSATPKIVTGEPTLRRHVSGVWDTDA